MDRNAHGRGDEAWETDLHRRYMGGDREAATELYHTHAAAITKLAIRYAKATNWDKEEAISAANEAFFAILLPRFQPGRARLLTMLYRCMAGHLRRARNLDNLIASPQDYRGDGHKFHEYVVASRQTSGTDELAESVGVLDEIDAGLVNDEERRRLKTALLNLPSRERIAVEAWYLEGKTLDEISETLGVCRERVRQIRDDGCERLAGLMMAEAAA